MIKLFSLFNVIIFSCFNLQAQNNHLSLQFNGGTSGYEQIDKGGTLVDNYNTLIHDQENGLFYNTSLGYEHSFGRFAIGVNLSWNRLQEKIMFHIDSLNAGSGNEYVGLTQSDDYRYRYLNASARVKYSIISHDKFSFGLYLQFGAAHIFSCRRKADIHFDAVYDSYFIDEASDVSNFRPFIMNAGTGLFSQHKLSEKLSLFGELNYTSFLQHWVKLDVDEKSWYRYYSATAGLGVRYSF